MFMDIALDKKDVWVTIDLTAGMGPFNHEPMVSEVNSLLKVGEKFIAFEMKGIDFLNVTSLLFFSSVAQNLQKRGGMLAFISSSESLLESIKLFDFRGELRLVGHHSELPIL